MYPYSVPGWVRYGATIDLDFVNRRYYGGGISNGNATFNIATKMGSLLNGTDGNALGTMFCPDSAGILRSFPQFGLKITDRGLWVQAASTNYCQFSRNLTGAGWTAGATMTVTNTTIPGANAATSGASRLTGGAASATNTIFYAITQASTGFTASCYMKRNTGTGVINMSVDGGATYTDITSQLNSSTYSKIEIPSQTLANPSIGFQIITNGDKVDVDMVQCENNVQGNTKATTPMLTAGTTITRGGGSTDEAFFNNQSVAAGYNDGWRIIQDIFTKRCSSGIVEFDGNATLTSGLVIGTDVAVIVETTAANKIFLKNGNTGSVTTTSTNAANLTLGTTDKVGFSLGGGRGVIAVNGVLTVGATQKFTTDVPSHGGVGAVGSGAQAINGPYQRITLFNRDITDGELINYTT